MATSRCANRALRMDRTRSRGEKTRENGFSLIEVLVAITILSIAGAALIRTAQDHAGRLTRLEASMLAQIVAANRLVELRLNGDVRRLPGEVVMGGEIWRIETHLRPTSDPDLAQADIFVFGPGQSQSVGELTGFVDTARPNR